MKDREGVTKNYLTVWPFDQHEFHSIGMRKPSKMYKYKIYNQLQYFHDFLTDDSPKNPWSNIFYLNDYLLKIFPTSPCLCVENINVVATPLQIRTKSVANPIYRPLHETDLERISSELEAKEKLCIRVLSERILAASLRERCHVYRIFFMSY